MAQEVEMESKNLLTKQEYENLIEYLHLSIDEAKKQVNYYFETLGFLLKQNGCALRIRVKNNVWVLTLKQPYKDGLLETHDQLTEAEAIQSISNQLIVKANVAKQLSELKIDNHSIQFKGTLETHRLELPYKNGLVVLDKSKYNNCVDYELEIESSSMRSSEKLMKELIENNGITIKNTPNKIERFFNSLSQ